MAKKKIYEQQYALSAYFNDMLSDSTESSREEFENLPETSKNNYSLKQTIMFPSAEISHPTTDIVATETVPSPLTDEEKPAENLSSATESTLQKHNNAESTTETSAFNTQARNSVIKILLCNIGGMKVAIKVDALDNIIRWPTQGLSQIPGRKSWEVGLFNDNGQNTNVIDIRKLLHTPDIETALDANYILLVNDRRTGIACDNIEQIINKNSQEINWRHDTSQRPWFTGVLSETMHSILDIPAIINALD